MQVSALDRSVRVAPAAVLCASQRLVREALTEAFEFDGEIRIVATARDASEAIAEAERYRPGVVIVSDDIGWTASLDAARTIGERVPSSSVLLLVSEEEPGSLADAVEAGARGYIGRRVGVRQLRDVVLRLADGLASIPDSMVPALLDRLVDRRSRSQEGNKVLTLLSDREREVLLLLTEGASTDSVAETLVVTRETARKHIQNILLKMGVRSRLEAVAYVVQDGRRALLRADG
jgi:DNA-binding NarL/FixJ family response regulator